MQILQQTLPNQTAGLSGTLQIYSLFKFQDGLIGSIMQRQEFFVKLNLSTLALEIATQKQDLWEYRLFAQVLLDEIQLIKELDKQNRYN